jgi:hypothetical protein
MLSSMSFAPPAGLEDLIELDAECRRVADEYIQSIQR